MDSVIKELAQRQEVGVWKAHTCPSCQHKKGRRILNIKKCNGYIMYQCFSDACTLHGYHRINLNGQSVQDTRKMLLGQKKYDKNKVYQLPNNFINHIPKKYLTYLEKYSIYREEINLYNIGYCHEHVYNSKVIFEDRLVIPTPSGFLARSLNEQPKWKNFSKYDFKSKGVEGDTLVLCEDPISTICVGRVMPSMSLLGTSIKESIFIKVFKYKKVILFLDGDKAGIKGSLKIKSQLDPYIYTRIYNVEGKDPKDLNEWEIKELLR